MGLCGNYVDGCGHLFLRPNEQAQLAREGHAEGVIRRMQRLVGAISWAETWLSHNRDARLDCALGDG